MSGKHRISALPQRVLLRAEIVHDGGRIVTHTLGVAPRALLLATQAPLPAGSSARILLSFPRLVQPFEVVARVAALPGEGGALRFDVESGSEDALAFLAAIGGGEIEPASPSRQSYRCLLVEDNNFIRDLFAYGMEKYRKTRSADISIALANDAEEAWDMLALDDYDLAIVDFYLPTQSGSQLIARMRAEPRLADMAVVAISVGGAEARDASLGAGADLFLDKPIVMRDLFATLDKLTVHEVAR
jgi:CheY-like chemotaxis protein